LVGDVGAVQNVDAHPARAGRRRDAKARHAVVPKTVDADRQTGGPLHAVRSDRDGSDDIGRHRIVCGPASERRVAEVLYDEPVEVGRRERLRVRARLVEHRGHRNVAASRRGRTEVNDAQECS